MLPLHKTSVKWTVSYDSWCKVTAGGFSFAWLGTMRTPTHTWSLIGYRYPWLATLLKLLFDINWFEMKFFRSLLLPVFSLSVGSAFAASWGIDDATLTVQSKGAGVGGGLREKWVLAVTCTWKYSNTNQVLLGLTTFQRRVIGSIRHPQDRPHNHRRQHS